MDHKPIGLTKFKELRPKNVIKVSKMNCLFTSALLRCYFYNISKSK
jgi:hypothetical protein